MWQLTRYYRRDASANWKCFWGLGHQRSNFDGYIHSHYAAPPYSEFLEFGLHQRHLFPPVWQHLVGFGFRAQRVASMHNVEFTKMGENSDLILSRLWTKVHEIFRRCRKPLVLSNGESNALFRLSVSRFVQNIFANKSRSRRKTEQMQTFLASNFCGRDGSDFSTAVC